MLFYFIRQLFRPYWKKQSACCPNGKDSRHFYLLLLSVVIIFCYAAFDAEGLGVTGREGVGAVGVGDGISVADASPLSDGLSDASSDGEGLGVSDNSPKMFVGPEKLGVLKAL